MDSRTRYPLTPVVAEGSPAYADPGHSSIAPGTTWESRGEYGDIRYEVSTGDDAGIAKITIDRPEVRNAFRPQTLFELQHALNAARDDDEIGVIVLTGQGDWAFCSGGDQRIRGNDGYIGDDDIAHKGIGRLNVLDLQVQIRRTPKPVVAMVAGYAIGGGHVLHICCDLTIAADNARFGQTGPKVGSFDGGYGSGLLARQIGQKRAREIWFLCRQYGAEQAYDWGLVNSVVPLEDLERETVQWAQRDARRVAAGAADAQGLAQRRGRRPRRHPAARRRRDAALLHDRGGAGGPRRLQGQAPSRVREVPQAPMTPSSVEPVPQPAETAAAPHRSRREQRADVRRQRLVDAQLGPEPGAADPAPRGLAARARSLWCGFVSGLG